MSNVRVTMVDVRNAGYCAAGLRSFCEMHGLDLVKLVREGWEESDTKHIEDAHLTRVWDVAKERARGEE